MTCRVCVCMQDTQTSRRYTQSRRESDITYRTLTSKANVWILHLNFFIFGSREQYKNYINSFKLYHVLPQLEFYKMLKHIHTIINKVLSSSSSHQGTSSQPVPTSHKLYTSADHEWVNRSWENFSSSLIEWMFTRDMRNVKMDALILVMNTLFWKR